MLVFSPSLLLAHPGHHHPDETDEFDFLRATFFHRHGDMDYVLAVVVLLSLGIAIFAGKRSFRVGASIVACGSLIVIPFV